MITINGEIYLTRKETAELLGVSVHTMAIWRSRESHPVLHAHFFKWKSMSATYKLTDIGEFLKQWNPVRYYDDYPRISKLYTDCVAKPRQ